MSCDQVGLGNPRRPDGANFKRGSEWTALSFFGGYIYDKLNSLHSALAGSSRTPHSELGRQDAIK